MYRAPWIGPTTLTTPVESAPYCSGMPTNTRIVEPDADDIGHDPVAQKGTAHAPTHASSMTAPGLGPSIRGELGQTVVVSGEVLVLLVAPPLR